MSNTARARTDLIRRLADWMRGRRLDDAGRSLLAEAEAALSAGRGRPRKLTASAADAAIAEHGSIERAAKALEVAPNTVRAAIRG